MRTEFQIRALEKWKQDNVFPSAGKCDMFVMLIDEGYPNANTEVKGEINGVNYLECRLTMRQLLTF